MRNPKSIWNWRERCKGNHLIDFAEVHKLFQEAKNRYWAWESPDADTRNEIIFSLSNHR